MTIKMATVYITFDKSMKLLSVLLDTYNFSIDEFNDKAWIAYCTLHYELKVRVSSMSLPPSNKKISPASGLHLFYNSQEVGSLVHSVGNCVDWFHGT